MLHHIVSIALVLISITKVYMYIYNGYFLCCRNGEEWYKFRAAILPLLHPRVVKAYADCHTQVASRFVDYIQMKINETSSDTINDICQDLMKFSIEGISSLFDKQSFNTLHTGMF